MMRNLANYVMFQLGWFACVLGAANGKPIAGPLVVVGAVALHLGLADKPARELRLLAACALIGMVFDSALVMTGWVSYPSGNWAAGLAPYWIVAMWVLFGTTLNLSMAWMKGRAWAAVVLGGAGGPLSYLAGEALGGITLAQREPALLALGCGWAVIMPVLAGLARRLNGFETRADSSRIRESWEKGASEHA